MIQQLLIGIFVKSKLKLGAEIILQFVDENNTDKILVDIDELCSKHTESPCIIISKNIYATGSQQKVKLVPQIITIMNKACS